MTAGGRGSDFDEFYLSHFTRLVVLATLVAGERAGAEDIAQEAMLDAHRRWDRIGSYDSPRAWVRRVVVQRSWKVARKRSNERVAHLRSTAATNVEIAEPFDEQLLEALRSLPNRQRAVVVLHYIEDISVAEVAELLEITTGSVKTHLSRARSALLAELSDLNTTEPR